MALVFQYGSNTSSTRMNSEERLRGDARDLGLVCTESVFELGFDVWSTGNACAAADIRESRGRRIWGVLYEVPDYLVSRATSGDRKSLDAIEGELYERRVIRVMWPDATPVTGEVTTYVARNPEVGRRTSIEYVSHIISGLRAHGAPDEYLAYLKERVISNNPDLAAQVGLLVMSRVGKSEAEIQLEQVKLLFDYTKFHIGLYTTVTAAYIAVMASDYGKRVFFVPDRRLVWSAVVMFLVAGFAGGIIASSCPHYPRLDALMAAKIAPFTDRRGFTGRTWTYIEHTAFWVGIILAILSFACAQPVPVKPLWPYLGTGG